MLKRLLGLTIALVFVSVPCVSAAKNYEQELVAETKELKRLTREIADLKKQLRQIKDEYIEAEKRLHKEIGREEAELARTEGKEKAHKVTVREGKQRQAGLRNEYYKKKRPLVRQVNNLKHAHRQCQHRIRNLEAKIDRIAEGYFEDEDYVNQIDALKQQLAQLKEGRDQALAQLEDETDERLVALVDKEKRAKARKEILSEAKDKEVALWKDYNAKKEKIKEEIDLAKMAHRERVREHHEQKKSEERASITGEASKKGASDKATYTSNFGPR